MVSVDVKHHVCFTSCNLSGKSKTRSKHIKKNKNKKLKKKKKKKGGGGAKKERYLLKFKYCFVAWTMGLPRKSHVMFHRSKSVLLNLFLCLWFCKLSENKTFKTLIESVRLFLGRRESATSVSLSVYRNECLSWDERVKFCFIQFSARWYLCAWKRSYALCPVFRKYFQRRRWNSSPWSRQDAKIQLIATVCLQYNTIILY